jgi:hypothetical protein
MELFHWDNDLTFVKDDDQSDQTRGKAEKKVRAAQRRLGIECEVNPPQSPDPMETIRG